MSAQSENNRPKSNWAQIASAVIAGFAFVIVVAQVYFISKNFKEVAARQVYMSYSESALRHPEYAEPDLLEIKADRKKLAQYKNYVAHLLFAYDEMLEAYDKPEWRKSFDEEIKYHRQYICEDMPPTLDEIYFENMRKLLREIRAKCPAKN
ncbi:hypothetical protein AAFX91_11780 [Bradyrhizobium sp. 31Argb]|uniref:hypothetical protein n=1 Tax=unclassified Bradyrhizobium TaxID=2631580 RepID=UPI00102E8E48|nr:MULTISPECIES: hypothetical protein [unclassified Bradyrhizobium]MDI4232363.1 hypothetical protein [Bradyrhizobium sp. Arg237L]TAI60836.1 hypothetical protein CWO89_38480 [Bradyrhizobium sp. Leo170]